MTIWLYASSSNLQEELCVGISGAEQHGAGSGRPRGHGQD